MRQSAQYIAQLFTSLLIIHFFLSIPIIGILKLQKDPKKNIANTFIPILIP